ncbi:hypothetical protein CTAYLR_006632 [Chrysophaeum taylorii]|uniref:POPDC1-3 domain-containing protein n=1 Tax=Chrysophaeum taylorii TaxID=2483200 RepID=A0AAD7UMF0_9STRA|nr:hypothetical protein CTAYLR_006632 [Chrysophaeum taylorii]
MAPILPPLWDGLLGNISQSSALLVYAFVDPLQLQIVAFFSAWSQVVFFVLQRPPVLIFIFWDSLQGIINFIQIIILVMELTPVKFSEQELEVLTLMSHVFDEVPSRKIARVLRQCGAKWVRYEEGDLVVKFDNGLNADLVYIVEGSVNAFTGDGDLAIEARPGTFLAEASLSRAMLEEREIDDDDDKDSVAHLDYAAAAAPSLCIVWPIDRLAKALKADDELRDVFRQALAVDLCRKIAREAQRGLDGRNNTVVAGSRAANKETYTSKLYSTVFGGDDSPSLLREAEVASSVGSNRGSNGSSVRPKVSSRRVRRKKTILSVMGFINSGIKQSEERAKFLPRADSSDSSRRYDSTRSTSSAPSNNKKVVPPRPVGTRRPSQLDERKQARRGFYARSATGVAVAVAVLVACYLAYKSPSSTVGNGSQLIITGAFAITDPLTLQVVSFVGSTAQACFFIFRRELIWSSIAWSSAQALVNFVMATYIYYATRRGPKENVPKYSERELFASRCLQRAAPLDHPTLRALAVGDGPLDLDWRRLDRGEHVFAGRFEQTVALVTDGAVRVTRLDGASFDARRGSILGTRALLSNPDFVSLDANEAVQVIDYPCEILSWPAPDLKTYLDTNQDARFAFSVLAASTATQVYLEHQPLGTPIDLV